MPTSSPPQCQVVLSLAHLLGHNSPSYEDEKNALLDASVRCASSLAGHNPEGEVHLILTGSPRPTFAETNAWLLDRQASTTTTPRKRNVDFAGSYSIADNDVDMTTDDVEEGEGEGDDDSASALDENNNLDDMLAECAHDPASPVATGGGEGGGNDAVVANTSFFRRHTFPAHDGGCASQRTTNVVDGGGEGPMVGHAVVNAISQAKGVGLHSSRAKLLQGTIDRPDWIQSRWTDGECVFGELVSRCGLDSFENTAGGGRRRAAAADGGRESSSSSSSSSSSEVAGTTTTSTKGSRLRKTTNLSAHLVTVPSLASARDSATSSRSTGITGEETTIEEIARGVLRCLKRKGSPPAHGVYLVFPPDGGGGGERTTTISSLLAAAFKKLERYNDMIGAPRLMADARFEFVPVSI